MHWNDQSEHFVFLCEVLASSAIFYSTFRALSAYLIVYAFCRKEEQVAIKRDLDLKNEIEKISSQLAKEQRSEIRTARLDTESSIPSGDDSDDEQRLGQQLIAQIRADAYERPEEKSCHPTGSVIGSVAELVTHRRFMRQTSQLQQQQAQQHPTRHTQPFDGSEMLRRVMQHEEQAHLIQPLDEAETRRGITQQQQSFLAQQHGRQPQREQFTSQYRSIASNPSSSPGVRTEAARSSRRKRAQQQTQGWPGGGKGQQVSHFLGKHNPCRNQQWQQYRRPGGSRTQAEQPITRGEPLAMPINTGHGEARSAQHKLSRSSNPGMSQPRQGEGRVIRINSEEGRRVVRRDGEKLRMIRRDGEQRAIRRVGGSGQMPDRGLRQQGSGPWYTAGKKNSSSRSTSGNKKSEFMLVHGQQGLQQRPKSRPGSGTYRIRKANNVSKLRAGSGLDPGLMQQFAALQARQKSGPQQASKQRPGSSAQNAQQRWYAAVV